MDDLKKLSVERLRELARKHLGKGHSRLRTRAQLLAALTGALEGSSAGAADPTGAAVPADSPVRVVDFPPGRKGRVRAEHTAPKGGRGGRTAPPSGSGSTPRTAAPVARKRAGGGGSNGSTRGAGGNGSAGRGDGSGGARRPRAGAAPSAAPASTPGPVAPRVEPVVEEAFFETPQMPRRQRHTPVPLEQPEPGPLASPREVGTDAPLLLVRDPTTLFVFWDFRRELERGAALGLREPRVLLRIYRGADLDRSLELPLGARSTYVSGLASGEEYTAEVLLLGRDGWTRPIGNRSGARRLPPGRVSAGLEVRTLRLPWSEPLGRGPGASAAAPGREPLDSPRRVTLPSSPGARGPGHGPSPSGGPRSGRN